MKSNEHAKLLRLVYRNPQEVWRREGRGCVFYVGQDGRLFPSVYGRYAPVSGWVDPADLVDKGWHRVSPG